MSPQALSQYIDWLTIIAGAILYVRLRREDLHRVYRWFAILILFHAAQGAALHTIPAALSSLIPSAGDRLYLNAYGGLWLATEPFLALLYVLVVLELYGLVFQKYRGIASLGRWAVFAGLVIGIAIAAFTLSADLSNPNEKFPLLRYFFVLQRGITSSLLIFLLFLTVFLVWYPVPLSRNLIAHSILFAAYFLSVTLAFLVRNLGGSQTAGTISFTLAATSLACFIVWTSVLNRAGERRSVSIGQQWNQDEQQHILDQLAAINSALLRTARK